MLTPNTEKVLLKNLNFCFEDMYDEKNKVFFKLEKNDLDWYYQTFRMKDNIVFMNYFNIVGFPPIGLGEELYTLDQILDSYNDPSFWWDEIEDHIKKQYPNASKRYLQFTSIEGGGSYFYDKETDNVYNVNWGEEESMVIGKLEPWFKSFYDFLEWYYSKED